MIPVELDSPIGEAVQLLAERRIGRLRVLDGDNFVGLIITTDILRYCRWLGMTDEQVGARQWI